MISVPRTAIGFYWSGRARLALNVDTRTATEYGVVRTFGQTTLNFTTLGGSTYNPSLINGTSPIGGTQLLDVPGGGYATADLLFLQFAGFTFSDPLQRMLPPWNGYPGNSTSFLLGGHDTVLGVNNIYPHRAVRQRRVGHRRPR